MILLAWSLKVPGQTGTGILSGKVSFLSSSNVYVKFSSTNGISVGDTLHVTSGGKMIPALIVNSLSSTSCLCTPFPGITLAKDHLVFGRIKAGEAPSETKAKTTEEILQDTVVIQGDASPEKDKNEAAPFLRGSISVNSYTDLSNTPSGNIQRYRYTLLLKSNDIAGSGVSFETYISFKHKTGEWDTIRKDIFRGLKIYSLALGYEPRESMHIYLGRRINSRITNIGPVDGLQFEKSFGKFTFGAVAGMRPDYADYGFNFNLLQYGGFASFDAKLTNGFTSASIAFMQQTNNMKTDRRFLYFQHSGMPLKNLWLLSTFEVDLYKLENGSPKSTFDLTGAFISLKYRAWEKLTLSGSYDARKNVMYYETYKSYLDRILETETRQGYRFEAGYRASEKINVGVRSGYRFMKADPHPSGNLGGYFTWAQLPATGISATLSATYLRTGFMNGFTAGISLSGDYSGGKVQPGLSYYYTGYSIPEGALTIRENVAELSVSAYLTRNLSLSAYYELTTGNRDMWHRIYLQTRIRF